MLPRAPELVQRHAETWRRYSDPTQWTNPNQPTSLQLSWEASSWPIGAPGAPVVVWPDPQMWPQPDGTWQDLWWTVAKQLQAKPRRFLFWTIPGKAPGIVIPLGALRGAQGTTDLGLLIDDDPDRPELGGWEVLGLRPPWPWEAAQLAILSGGGFDGARGDLIAGAVARRTPATADRITFCGAGGPKRCGMARILRAADLAGPGRVVEPLSVVGYNLETGPAASKRAPARRVEHPDGVSWHPDAPDRRLIPQVTWLAADPAVLTDREIEARLRARGLVGPLFESCRELWRATRGDHVGMVVGRDTGHGSPLVECDAMADGYPGARAWRDAGFTRPEHARDAFAGYPFEALYVVDVPS